MLLRISLIIAVIAAAVALGFSFQVRNKIQAITAESKKNADERDQANTARQSAEKKAKDTEAKAKEIKGQYDSVTNELATASAKAREQQRRADTLQADLEKTTKEKNEAQQFRAAFDAIGIPLETVKSMKGQNDRLSAERDALTEEKVIFSRQISVLTNELAKYTNPNREVKLPPALKGKVLAVDPKFNFIVLDIGSNQGLIENGKLTISRDGRLVAKVQVVKLEPTRSVANLLAEWQQAEIVEGDIVQTAYEALAQP
jgi:DNA repair exonuclease SbcCD ATPase subunit